MALDCTEFSVCNSVFFPVPEKAQLNLRPKWPQMAVDEISAVHLWGVAELLILMLLIF